MDEEDYVDELMDWMCETFDQQEQETGDANPTIDLSNYEVGMTGNQIDYMTDGKDWNWY